MAILWKWSSLNTGGNIIEFLFNNNNSVSFEFKTQVTSKTEANGTKNVDTKMRLKYLSSVWWTLETPLINCEINFILTWS